MRSTTNAISRSLPVKFIGAPPIFQRLKFYFFFSVTPCATNCSMSLFTLRISSDVAVQNTGLVMQWCPLQLPSSFWILTNRAVVLSYQFFQQANAAVPEVV